MIDFSSINADLILRQAWRQWLPGGTMKGAEWVTRNPMRADKTPGSMSVNTRTGRWADFACDAKGGDLVSLYAYLFCDGDQGRAARELSDGEAPKVSPSTKQAPRETEDSSDEGTAIPIPVGMTPPCNHPTYGHESSWLQGRWEYTDAAGVLLFWEVRIATEKGKTYAWQSVWEGTDGVARWRWKGWPSPRPLFQLQRLAKEPSAKVVWVEGAKTAKALQSACDQLEPGGWVVTACAGGGKAVPKTDMSLLSGRVVVVWPDNDAPGATAAKMVRAAVAASQMGVVRVPPGKPPKWDAWDCVMEESDARGALRLLHEALQPADPAMDVHDMELVGGWPQVGERGKPKGTIPNMRHLLGHYGVVVSYCEIAKSTRVEVPHLAEGSLSANAARGYIESICELNEFPTGKIDLYLPSLAAENVQNPVREWIESEAWDGVDRVDDLMSTITLRSTADAELCRVLVWTWMRMAAAVGCANAGEPVETHGVLIFQGRGGAGKGRWISRLAPKWVKTGKQIDPENKDSKLEAAAYWIVEMTEVDGMSERRSNALKAYVTESVDVIRRPYARAADTMQRRTAFVGSANPEQFLSGDTGDRRYWTIPVDSMQYEHDLPMQQVWAQALAEVRQGAPYWLTDEGIERLGKANKTHTLMSVMFDHLDKLFAISTRTVPPPPHGPLMTTTEILKKAGVLQPTSVQCREMAAALREVVGEPETRSKNVLRWRVWPQNYADPSKSYDAADF